MRTPIIAGNWKMNTTLSEAVQLVKAMRDDLDRVEGVIKVFCPPFISIAAVAEALRGSSVRVGAQNVYHEKKGAYTGEVSPLMLTSLCEYVIIGHSERRQYFNETEDLINKKIGAALAAGLKPILCVGEKLAENEAGRTEEVIGFQLRGDLAGVQRPDSLVIAYEPVWAIGTGRAATGAQANETIGFIRRLLGELYDNGFARQRPVLYGGSVTADNIAEFIRQPEIDGGLVGGASLNPAHFTSIVRQTAQLRS